MKEKLSVGNSQRSKIREIPETKMSLGLRLLAHFSKPAQTQTDCSEQIEKWVRKRCSEMHPKTRREEVGSIPTLYCQFHPAAEEVELEFLGPSQLVVSANTTTVGPGYHVFVTSLLKELAQEFQAQWERPKDDSPDYGDETGFFFTGNENSLKDEMTRWLAAVASSVLDSPDSEGGGSALCMPMSPQFEVDAAAWGPLGPLSREWLQNTALNGASGMDFFAWPTPGFNAEYYLGRALAQMWVDVRWRNPVNEAERVVLEDVADSLHRAFEFDPGLHYPWAEWKQVLGFLNRKGKEAAFVTPHVEGPPVIGYRRKEIHVVLPGGWGMKIPGSFSEFESDDQNDLCALDPPREIWFTAYRFDRASSHNAFVTANRDEIRSHAEHTIEHENYFGSAALSKGRRSTGEEYFVLKSSNLAPRGRSICTILFSDAEEEDWAVNTWRSIVPPPTKVN